MAVTSWLLDVEVDGVPYRWSVNQVEVDGDLYETGLGDLAPERGADSVNIQIADSTLDWPSLAYELEGRTATVSRWDGVHEPEVYVRGEVQDVAYGSREEPVTFAIRSSVAAALGRQVPDPLARVDETTWVAGNGDNGRPYPVIYGFPGDHLSGVEAVVPVPLAQWDALAAQTFVVVADDLRAPITSVTLYNKNLDASAPEDVVSASDTLGRRIRVADFSSSTVPKPTSATEARDLYAGYTAAGGGGAYRDAYSVLLDMLQRSGTTDVDRDRLPEVKDLLSTYMVDTWIDDPVPDGWAWFEGALLPDLPVEIRTSKRGRYLVERRYVSDPRRIVRAVNIDLGDGAAVGPVTLDTEEGPANEFSAYFRSNRDGDWLGLIVLTGDGTVHGAPSVPPPTAGSSQLTVVGRNPLCAASFSRYGLRQADPIQLDWTWDEGTVLKVLNWRAQRDAVPARLATYRIDDGADLVEGDEVLLTDTRRGFVAVAAIVDGPPLVSSASATVPFRIPWSAAPRVVVEEEEAEEEDDLAVITQTFLADGTWTRPAGHTQWTVELQGGGGGGGKGEAAADGTARQGGGGGGAGARTIVSGPIPCDTVYVQVGLGGAGGAVNNGVAGGRSMLSVKSGDFTTPYIIAACSQAGAIGGEWGLSGGSGGSAASVWAASNTRHGDYVNFQPFVGQTGSAGGNGAAGANLTPAARSVTAGSGGGGRSVANADFAGGTIAASGDMAAVAGGLAGGGAGNNGATASNPFQATGGSGGGGGATGGAGGVGAAGCGGGGGGGGVAGGNGGAGGNGWVTISSW